MSHFLRKFKTNAKFGDKFFRCQFVAFTKYIQINAYNNKQTSPNVSEIEKNIKIIYLIRFYSPINKNRLMQFFFNLLYTEWFAEE